MIHPNTRRQWVKEVVPLILTGVNFSSHGMENGIRDAIKQANMMLDMLEEEHPVDMSSVPPQFRAAVTSE